MKTNMKKLLKNLSYITCSVVLFSAFLNLPNAKSQEDLVDDIPVESSEGIDFDAEEEVKVQNEKKEELPIVPSAPVEEPKAQENKLMVLPAAQQQPPPTAPQAAPPAGEITETIPLGDFMPPKKRTGLFSLKKSVEIKNKSENDMRELINKGRAERASLREKEKLERAELNLKERKERSALREKQKIEKNELKQKQEARTAEVKKIRNEKMEAKGQINDRLEEIRKARWSKRSIEIITDENDPIYIVNADVIDGKTEFLKIKSVDYKYKLSLVNQTPKIINSVLIIWERKIPFTDTLTIAKRTRISRPIIPYEKRIVQYNDLNSKRDGETYRVKIAKVLFEDGTQWKNPLIKDNELQ